MLVILGSALTALSFGWIILPQSFAAGGVTGLAALLNHWIPIPVSTMVLILNLLLFFSGWMAVGKEFALKSLLTTLIFPVFLEFFTVTNCLAQLAADPLLSAVLAGTLLGGGAGMILLGNGSGGGFDVLGVILNKKFRISISLVMYCFDFIIILAYAMVNPFLKTVYGLAIVVIAGFITNQLLLRGKSSVEIQIFSAQFEKIARELLHQHDVGLTYLNGETGYLSSPIKVIVTVVPYNKVNVIKRCVYGIDPTAFFLMQNARYVGGRGYTIDR